MREPTAVVVIVVLVVIVGAANFITHIKGNKSKMKWERKNKNK